MNDIEKLEYEINEFIKIYMMARELHSIEKDPEKKKYYRTHLLRCYDLIVAKQERLKRLKAKPVEKSKPAVNNQKSEVKYYYAKIYHPFLRKEDMKHIAITEYQIIDKIKDVYYTEGKRSKKGLFGYYDQTYYYKMPFPIIVEKDGDELHELLTGSELIQYSDTYGDKSQIRYDGRIYHTNEKYLSDKIAVSLEGEISKMVLADMLGRLDNSSKYDYIYKMNEVKDIIIKANQAYHYYKQQYESTHDSDDEIIRRYRGK